MQPNDLLRGLDREKTGEPGWRVLVKTAEVASGLIGLSVDEATQRAQQGNCIFQAIDMDMQLPPGTGRALTSDFVYRRIRARVRGGSVVKVSVG